MSELKGKIDFLLLITASDANPNGDPLNGNRPRENFDGYGEFDVFFFFNPFSEEVFGRVIDRILESRKSDGPLTFIYHNPRYLDALEERLKRAASGPEQVRKVMLHDKRKNYDTCILSM